ncbi:ras GTPase-activating protein 3-like [Gadus chalcogrammus]|uniref:ras GTPase-activating protein 3-like n=1 Tax=Gadus chalcogrammus TaxID=1042646 RepID=UPI0024C4888A|nr:ras GTPase-activating protein 3-like [Gadus chalcogrammus]
MAVEEEGLRVFQSVKIKIGEAKNIPPYPGPNKMRDCYCTVNLDQEEVFRTKIIEKSLCPFYGEDFYCEIPRSFRHLSFYIFDRDVFRRDSSIGKVAVQKTSRSTTLKTPGSPCSRSVRIQKSRVRFTWSCV